MTLGCVNKTRDFTGDLSFPWLGIYSGNLLELRPRDEIQYYCFFNGIQM